MRIPVFARRTNPAIDKPILRKNIGYGEEQVRSGLADWVSSGDHSKGIIAREMLRSGKCFLPVETVSVSTALPRVELPGLKFQPPKDETKPSFAAIREGWDWQTESRLMTA